MIDASRCPCCERVAVPPEERCLACRARTESAELPDEGRVLTYTRTDDGWVALVEVEGGARVLARRTGGFEIGAEIALVEADVASSQD